MKKLILLFAILACLQHTAFSQNDWYYFPDEMYFVKEVPAKHLRGKEFRYQIAVKAMPTDTFSKVRINGVAAGKGLDDFLNNSKFAKEQTTDGDWTLYTITGTVPAEAFKLWFYSAVNGNGNFYFDNVQFYVREGNDWVQLDITNPSFETENKNITTLLIKKHRNGPTANVDLFFDTGKQKYRSLDTQHSNPFPDS